MKTKFKRVKIIALIVCTLAGLMGGISVKSQIAYAMTVSEFDGKLNSLRSRYPNYSVWDGECNGAWQCYGFAFQLYYDIFGTHTDKSNTVNSLDGVKPGDIIRYGPGDWDGHTIFVTGVSGNTITYVDCNGKGGSNKILWNQTIQKGARYSSSYSFLKRYPSPELQADPPTVSDIPAGNRTVADGDYHIVSAVTGDRFNPGSMCLSVDGLPGTKNTNANVCLWDSSGDSDTVFTVTRMSDGYYKIRLKSSDSKCLDVVDGEYAARTNVWQCTENGSDAQKWVIEEISDGGGGYAVRAKHGGRYLDVVDAGTTNGTNVWLFDGNGSAAQRWYFIPWGGGDAAKQEIADGEYQIVPKMDGTKAVHAARDEMARGTNIELSSRRNGSSQIFQTKWIGNGYYLITDKRSGLVLDVEDASSKQATNVSLYDAAEGGFKANQSWLIRSCGNGYYYIVSKCNGKYLDLLLKKAEEGTNITTCEGHGGDNQQWRFIPCGESAVQTLADGVYQIAPQPDENMRVSIAGMPAENGTNVELGESGNIEKQMFIVTYLENGLYKIVHKKSGRLLDVDSGGMEPETNVRLWEDNGADNQKWILRDCGDGYYNVISNSNGLYLNLYSGMPTSGQNICMMYSKDNAGQKWKFLPPIQAESISLQKKAVRLETDFQMFLKVGFLPEDTTDRTITWESSNPETATVSEDMGGKALVSAIAPGTTVITAISSNGKTASCTVTVAEEGGAHVHKYGDSYESDGYSHWKMCGCGQIAENEPHTYQTEVLPATAKADGAVIKTCNVCGHNVSREISKIADIALSETFFESDGTPKRPVVTVTDSRGAVLVEGMDYSVSCPEDAVNPDVYQVEITFTGNYSGKVLKEFRITGTGGTDNTDHQDKEQSISYTYKLNTDKTTITITKCTAADENIVIPSSIDGYAVTGIDEKVFQNITTMKTVSFPSSLKSIGNYAFSGCTSLTMVTLPESLTELGNYAFQGCAALQSAKLNAGLMNISEGLFQGCTSLSSVTMPDMIQYIRPNAFSGCTSLKTLSLSKSLSIVYANAFLNSGIKVIQYAGTNTDWQNVTIGTTGNTSFLNATVTGSSGKTFSANKSKWNTSSPAPVKKPTVSKVKSFKAKAGKKKLTLTWKKFSGVAGYQVQISTKKNFKGAKKISISKSKKTYTKKSLKAKKKYYIRIRAYKTYKDANQKTRKVYGKWTTINKKTK